ncbi:hypothetical protein AGMMS50256_27540 [Betaproteobacteria bacterium]|nr:hypothetical protein AGMMS50256_27540 [Betaproteobacteria bacterium]
MKKFSDFVVRHFEILVYLLVLSVIFLYGQTGFFCLAGILIAIWVLKNFKTVALALLILLGFNS